MSTQTHYQSNRSKANSRGRTAAPRPPAETATQVPNRDGARGQMVQTFGIVMMASPFNPLPFPLQLPLGATLLVNSEGNGAATRRGPSSTSSAGRR
ncbi:hypothetical protein QBC33DRAFT_60811 [Phialemonium atrogriseum]|uniref:Uncharacterized protein n=1 Tax=Phialemonium atrogriseum TaxID=1093897 RepID=A0AAJ0C1L4_9PEZI|nr:uncharacterized protein QBC33DRAFT_60811 [Phialemonium atrogriseum]KAK1767852.1 hypothetical protein QBC33DRAFT_60811 [Phialemonium atrogriseum]